MKLGMLKNGCALVLLALVVSPFTAPFQTCNTHAAGVASLTEADDAGSMVAPLVTKAGRLTVTPLTRVVISHVVPVAFVRSFIPPHRNTRRDSVRPRVLRL
jgi:hypothetical protein